MLMCFLSHILKHNFRIYELDVHIESYDCNDTEERQPTETQIRTGTFVSSHAPMILSFAICTAQ